MNGVGLETLTRRPLAQPLNVQTPTLYWHFHGKEALINELATTAFAEEAPHLLPFSASRPEAAERQPSVHAFKKPARLWSWLAWVAGTRLTNTMSTTAAEQIAAHLLASGLPIRQTTVLRSTIYSYTLSFVMEEQAVIPSPDVRALRYTIAERIAKLGRTCSRSCVRAAPSSLTVSTT